MALFKITHLSTKAEVVLTQELGYRINQKFRFILRDVVKKTSSKGGNEYDAAIVFMLGQINVLSVSEDTRDFVLEKGLLLLPLFGCSNKPDIHRALLSEIWAKHGLDIDDDDAGAEEVIEDQENATTNPSTKIEPSTPSPVVASTAEKTPMVPPQIDEDALFEQAFNEIADDEKIVGTWSRAYSEAKGQEQEAKALYIQLRVDALKKQLLEKLEKEKLEAEQKEREKEELIKAAKEAALEAEQKTKEEVDPDDGEEETEIVGGPPLKKIQMENAIHKICDHWLPLLNKLTEKDLEAALNDPHITVGNFNIQVMGEGDPSVEDLDVYLNVTRVVEKKRLRRKGTESVYKEFDDRDKHILISNGWESTVGGDIGILLGDHKVGNFPLKEIRTGIIKIIDDLQALFPQSFENVEVIESSFTPRYSKGFNSWANRVLDSPMILPEEDYRLDVEISETETSEGSQEGPWGPRS